MRAAEARTGFSARLIEKDSSCSLVLRDLADPFQQGLVFKGGTSLSKVHADFFRLSEDLDFAVSISREARRSARRDAAQPFKAYLAELPERVPCFRTAVSLTGYNDSRQYNGELSYRSVVTGEEERLKIEIALREEVLLPAHPLDARTLLSDPSTGASILLPFPVLVLTLHETYAEKVRAALTRREPAIRDFFDIDHAVTSNRLPHTDLGVRGLIVQKLAVARAGGEGVSLLPEKITALRGQIETQLKPVLRQIDYEQFNLDRVLQVLEEVVALFQEG